MEYEGCKCYFDDYAGKLQRVKGHAGRFTRGNISAEAHVYCTGTGRHPGTMAWLDALPDNLDLCMGDYRASECPEAYQITVEILSIVLGYSKGTVRHRLGNCYCNTRMVF